MGMITGESKWKPIISRKHSKSKQNGDKYRAIDFVVVKVKEIDCKIIQGGYISCDLGEN